MDSGWRLDLYRYLWPFWNFRDVNVGTPMECRMNYRHNVDMRTGLPLFVLKWILLAALCLSMGDLCQRLSTPSGLIAVCSVLAALSLLMTAYITFIYLYLGRR